MASMRGAVLGSALVFTKAAEAPRNPRECVMSSPASLETAKCRNIDSVVGKVGETFHAPGNRQLQVA